MDSTVFDYRGVQQRYEECRVIPEFDLGYLRIRTIPGSTVLLKSSGRYQDWANQSAARGQDKPFMGMGSAGMFTDRVILSAANDLDYTWGVRRGGHGRKSPDLSFRPRDLTVPPAKYQVRSIKQNEHYPTIVVELANRNESWNRLVNDARRKAFARQTSIQYQNLPSSFSMLLGKTAQERGRHDDCTTDTKTLSQRSHENCVHYSLGCRLVGNPGAEYPGNSHSGL